MRYVMRPWLLIRGLDNVPSYCLRSLLTLWSKVLPGCRVVKCLRLFQAVPFGDGHTLGSGRSLHRNNPPTARVEQASSTGSFLRSLNKGDVRGLSCGIERFKLGDGVGFRLSL